MTTVIRYNRHPCVVMKVLLKSLQMPPKKRWRWGWLKIPHKLYLGSFKLPHWPKQSSLIKTAMVMRVSAWAKGLTHHLWGLTTSLVVISKGKGWVRPSGMIRKCGDHYRVMKVQLQLQHGLRFWPVWVMPPAYLK